MRLCAVIDDAIAESRARGVAHPPRAECHPFGLPTGRPRHANLSRWPSTKPRIVLTGPGVRPRGPVGTSCRGCALPAPPSSPERSVRRASPPRARARAPLRQTLELLAMPRSPTLEERAMGRAPTPRLPRTHRPPTPAPLIRSRASGWAISLARASRSPARRAACSSKARWAVPCATNAKVTTLPATGARPRWSSSACRSARARFHPSIPIRVPSRDSTVVRSPSFTITEAAPHRWRRSSRHGRLAMSVASSTPARATDVDGRLRPLARARWSSAAHAIRPTGGPRLAPPRASRRLGVSARRSRAGARRSSIRGARRTR